MLGARLPGAGRSASAFAPQPGRVFLGDGDGHFARRARRPLSRRHTHDRASAEGPVRRLQRGRPPGHVHLVSRMGRAARSRASRTGSTCRARRAGGETPPPTCRSSATSPTRRRSATSAGAASLDIFVGNGYGSGIVPYTLLNTGSGQFTLTRSEYSGGQQPVAGPEQRSHLSRRDACRSQRRRAARAHRDR